MPAPRKPARFTKPASQNGGNPTVPLPPDIDKEQSRDQPAADTVSAASDPPPANHPPSYQELLAKVEELTYANQALQAQLKERAEGELGRPLQEAVRCQDEHLHALADTVPALIWETDESGLIFLNRYCLDFFGEKADAFLGFKWAGFVHPEDAAAYVDTYQRAFASGEPYSQECRFRVAGGEYRWLLSTGRPMGLGRYVGCSVDITDRKTAEMELAATAARERLALESTRSGTFDWDLITGQVLWSPEHNAIFDFPTGQRAGHNEQWLTRLHPDDVPRMQDTFNALVRERANYQDEYRIIHRDGSVHWVAASGRIFYDVQGQPVRMIGLVRDVTASKEAEETLRASEAAAAAAAERLRLALETNRSGEWERNFQTGELLWSHQNNVIFDLPHEQRKGRQEDWETCVHPDDKAGIEAAVQAALAAGEDYQHEYRAIHRDGSVHWVAASGRAFYDAEGKPLRMIGVVQDINERKKAEQALAVTAERLRLALESSRAGTWDWDLLTGEVLWSPEYKRIFNLPPEREFGRLEEIRQLIHPDDRAMVREKAWEAIENRADYRFEFRVLHPDGKLLWVATTGVASYDASGKPVRATGLVEDITERKQAEEELATTAERLQLSLETSGEGEWEWNIETGEILWSPRHNAIFDFPPEQRIGRYEELVARLHPDDRERVPGVLNDALAQRLEYHEVEFRIIHRDGSVHWVMACARGFFAPDGTPTRMLGVVRDITESKEASDALRRSEAELRQLADAMPQIVWGADTAGNNTYFNQRWYDFSGWEPGVIGNERWPEVFHPDDFDAAVARWHEAVRSGEACEMEFRMKGANGEYHWFLSRARPVQGASGQVVRWYGTCTDITERKDAESALRTAKEEAERANAAKSEFLSRMSHELRTPLNAILGFGQVLELSLQDEQDTMCISHIIKGGQLLLSLIDEVLDLARVEAGELDLDLQPLAVGTLLRGCVGFVAKLALAGGIACTTKTTPASRTMVLADERRLRQVILNLLSNAIKYNHPGGKVTLRCEARPRDRVRILIKDTGRGISSEGLARLFVPFERLGQDVGSVEGTGLGLVVSRQLVEAMGGSLGVESQVGQGSTFWVELPVQTEETVSLKNTPVMPVGSARQLPSLRPATLLYVEDNASNQQMLRTIVSRLRPQWRYLSAADGISGLEQARRHRPSLVLLDLQLPGMKGDAVLSELRASPETREIPVVMLSADAMAPSRERLLASGANDYLSKPFDINDLLEKIEAILAAQP